MPGPEGMQFVDLQVETQSLKAGRRSPSDACAGAVRRSTKPSAARDGGEDGLMVCCVHGDER